MEDLYGQRRRMASLLVEQIERDVNLPSKSIRWLCPAGKAPPSKLTKTT